MSSRPFSVFNVYQSRVVDRMNYVRNLLKQDFDVSVSFFSPTCIFEYFKRCHCCQSYRLS
ncbi:hypothetical protein DTW90_32135 [Neorhizobium sp. P12A]|uniref:hypothetical protein n=1 Tax=Neorhizobium sp. P12A TaxID=2268027 RepID=UPI0011F03DAA|nr:hypothetical protein [Neorhizobium sp. P12A]KAA0689152.1 hypothetical protein DTW90_32135 [Neorhizobium sp. P12A]